MSCFFAIFSPSDKIDQTIFDQLKSAIKRDGYDGLSTYSDDQIAMGHLMLGVTPESPYEKQPLISPCGRFKLVGHFRLDYRDELGDKLGLTNHELVSTPDAMLVMKAYQKWKDNCVHHLEGDWAFVMQDAANPSLFIAKDPTGVSSLFYFIFGKSIYISSDPTVFTSSSFFPVIIDDKQFAYFSVVGLKMDQGSTLFKGLYCLPNGYSVRVADDLAVNENQFYHVGIAKHRCRFRFESDLVFSLKSVYYAAIRSRCRSHYEIGVFLSAGLDSSSVAAIGSLELEKSGRNLSTFTSIPSSVSKLTQIERNFSDESTLVQLFCASRNNVIPHFLSFDHFKLSEMDQGELRLDPFNPAITFNTFWIHGILKEAKKKNIRLMMTGQMGNFTVSADGYLTHLEMFLRLRFSTLYRELKAFARVNNITLLSAFKIRVLKILKFNFLAWTNKRFVFDNSFFLKNGALSLSYYIKHKRAFKVKRNSLIPGYAAFFSNRSLRIKQLQKNLYFANIYWALYAKTFGVDVTDPTADKRVVDFSLCICEKYFNLFGISKYLYKRIFYGLIPVELVNNKISMVQSFDFGDRLKNDKDFPKLLAGLLADAKKEQDFSVDAFVANSSKILNASNPNYKRREIAKLLHDISLINFRSNFKNE